MVDPVVALVVVRLVALVALVTLVAILQDRPLLVVQVVDTGKSPHTPCCPDSLQVVALVMDLEAHQ